MAADTSNSLCKLCRSRPAEISGYCRPCAESLRKEIYAAVPTLREREEAAKTERMRERWRQDRLRTVTQRAGTGGRQINKYLFSSTETCPVCEESFPLAKVYWSRLRAKGHASDFYTEYDEFSPYPYVVWVCSRCGYGAPMQVFHQLTALERQAIRDGFGGRQPRGDFSGERTLEQAEQAFKLALFASSFRLPRYGADLITGSLWLRLAWLYRENRRHEEESQCLKAALAAYEKAYAGDVPLSGELTRPKLEYLVGELHRRTGDLTAASQWFSRVLQNPEIKGEPQVEKMTRDQWQLLRDQMAAAEAKDTTASAES